MEKLLRQLIERVDILIKLHVLTGLRDVSKSEKIKMLYNMGVKQKDIAEILDTKLNTVTGVVSKEAKKKKNKHLKMKE